jgi:hypothetical protein
MKAGLSPKGATEKDSAARLWPVFRLTHIFGLTSAFLIANSLLSVFVIAQTTSANLPADCAAYASTPLPAEAEAPAPKSPPSCASYRSYRGIGRPVNYAEARACAWQERLAQQADLGQDPQEPIAWAVGGSLILADIYFNGSGVKRHIALAMRFACESDEGMANLARPAILKLNGSLPAHRPFEFCDYAATTLAMDFCTSYASEIEDDRRTRYHNSLKSSMPQEQQAAFEALLASLNSYIEAHAAEVDQGGSIHAIRTLSSQRILNELFHAELFHFEHKKWPPLSDSQVKTADTSLRREYADTLRRLQPRANEPLDQGAVTADHVSTVEEKWEKYRDAWVAFARLRYPNDVDIIRAEITLDRYRLLKTIR